MSRPSIARLTAVVLSLLVAAGADAGTGADGAANAHSPALVVACADFVVIDSRGSGAPRGLSGPGKAFYESFREEILRRDRTAVVRSLSNSYPAWGSIPTLVSALLKLPQRYHQSVNDGKDWLSNVLGAMLANNRCPDAKIVLSGYSQGAQVTGDVYQNTFSKRIAAVVLFGDPKFNGTDPAARGGEKGLDGALGTRPPFSREPGSTSAGRVLSYCHAGDPVCQGVSRLKFGSRFHTNYDDLGEPQAVAKLLAAKLGQGRTPDAQLPGLWDGGRFRVRPARIAVTCADGGEYRLQWTGWTTARAVGKGMTAPCRGSSSQISVIASRVVRHQFTRLEVRFGLESPIVFILAFSPIDIVWGEERWVRNPDSGLRPWP